MDKPEIQPPSYHRELLWNQVWQGLNFFAKFGLLFLLTPLMLRVWGPVQYGLFALANSLLVSLAVLDFGVRSSTRLRLCEAMARGDDAACALYLRRGAQAFGLICLVAITAALTLGATGGWSWMLRLPPGGDMVMTASIFLAALFMVSSLFLEPIAAAGKLSDLKKANTAGAAAAIPVLGAWVYFGGNILGAVFFYFLCLLLANGWLFASSPFPWGRWLRAMGRPCSGKEIIETLHHGGWFYATTLAIVAKTHALTFLVSSILGPAAAGLFYIFLRISESVAVLGVTSSDTNLASLASAADAPERARRFRQSYLYAALFCLHGCVGLAFLTGPFLHLWLPGTEGIPRGIGAALAVFGLGGAFSRFVVNSAMGLGEVRTAAVGNLLEATLVLFGTPLLISMGGLRAVFLGGGCAALALLPAAFRLALKMEQNFTRLWLLPLSSLGPALVLNGCFFAAGRAVGHWLGLVIAVGAAAVVGLYEWRRLHREPLP
jgi:O-antigen/teichoic acid export membrane protein